MADNSKSRLIFPLRHPTAVRWVLDFRYNSELNKTLLEAHERIQAVTPENDPRREIEAVLLRYDGQPMSLRQEMLLCSLIARCSQVYDLNQPEHLAYTLGYITRAEELAKRILSEDLPERQMQNMGAMIDVLDLKGQVLRAVSEYREATEAYQQALRILSDFTTEGASFDPIFEVELRGKVAMTSFLIGDFAAALRHVRQAALLLPKTDMEPRGAGNISWTYALINRARQEWREAFQRIEEANRHYRLAPPINSTCRVLTLGAEITMDMVEFEFGADGKRGEYLAHAANYVREALRVGEQVEDEAGLELAKLARARLARLIDSTDAVGVEQAILDVLYTASQMRDDSLLTMAQTALGVDMLAVGKTQLGRFWLEQAMTTAQDINAPNLAAYAEWRLQLSMASDHDVTDEPPLDPDVE